MTIGRKVDYWRLWWEHQENDEYWHQFQPPSPSTVTVPIFQQGGWFDPYSGSHLRSFAAIGDRVPNRVMIGPVVATRRRSRPSAATSTSPRALTVIRDHELVFYDRYLKDEDNDWEQRPPAELFVLGANEWRGENEWPLAGTRVHAVAPARAAASSSEEPPRGDEHGRPLRLRPGRPGADDRRRQLGADDDAGRADARSAPGPIDQRVLEAPRRRARLHERRAAPRPRRDRPGRDGALRGVERARHRLHRAPLRRAPRRQVDLRSPRASSARATATRTRATRPSCSSRARSPSTGSAATRWRTVFKTGHRIRLDVTSSSFPRFSRNLNTGEDVGTGTRMEVARQTVLHTAAYPSHLLLPVIPH